MDSNERAFAAAKAAHEAGNVAQAATAYEEILAADPRHAGALQYLGVAHLQTGDPGKAIALIEQAVSLEPNDPKAWSNLGSAYFSAGRFQDAVPAFENAARRAPSNAGFLANLAAAHERAGDPRRAFEAYRRALGAQPTPPLAQAFLRTLGAGGEAWSDAGPDGDLLSDILTAVSTPGVDARPVGKLVYARLNAALAAAGDAPAALLEDAVFAAVADAFVFANLELEQRLTTVRQALLRMAISTGGKISPGLTAVAAAIAKQCFLNEFVWDTSDAERTAVDGLLRHAATWSPFATAVYGCYRPLGAVADIDRLISRHGAALVDLFRVQVAEPREEARLAAGMAAATRIREGVSREVRAMYEENPYPRWSRIDRLPAVALRQALAEALPAVDLAQEALPEAPAVLIAGCGTGHHAIMTAQRLQGATVTAMDLSKASLAYAARKAAELGVENITFVQGDILELGETGWAFDVIESAGVIHHMEHPLSGWRSLLSVLKPEGFMKIGVYSKTARTAVHLARDLIREKGFTPDLSGIRACRAFIRSLPPSDPLRRVTAVADFFSASDCRDLLFHVQEHIYTIPRLAAEMAELNLEFLGFHHGRHNVVAGFREMFPDGADLLNLGKWEAFEQANPHAFVGMYQFWVRPA